MNHAKKVARAALASVISLGVLGTTQQAVAADKPDYVKCYGAAAAGKNDCGTVVSACAGTIKVANACYAWVFLPKGECLKVKDASVGKPADGCMGPNGQPAK